jgi:esterase
MQRIPSELCVDFTLRPLRERAVNPLYLRPMKLFFREAGQGQPLIILHGLFGSSDNWYSLSKIFATKFRVFTIDQRNHGQSPHSDDHSYKLLTEDLEEFINDQKLEKPIILGHSMGGKVAMNFAIKDPSKTGKLIVVDIMPKSYPLHHDHILSGMKSLDLTNIKSRGEAEAILAPKIPKIDERQFIMKNLARSPSRSAPAEQGDEQQHFEWKINLDSLDKNIEKMGEPLQYEGQYTGPTLFIKGGKSWYYKDGDEATVAKYFPNAQWVTLDTGHWVQAEKPKEFEETVLNWLST